MTWFPQMKVCHATMQQAAARRRWEELHPSDGMVWHDGTHRNWSSKQDKRFMFHRDDGVTIFATEADFGLGGDFLKLEAEKGLRRPAGTQLAGGIGVAEGDAGDRQP